jgi:hypothetical protein
MADKTLFEELKDVLTEFEKFLTDNVATIRPAIQQIANLVPQVKDLITELSGLLVKLRAAVANLDVSGIPGVAAVAGFTAQIPALLDAARKLLPGEGASIDAISQVTSVVTGLPSVADVKVELDGLLKTIIDQVDSLKA